MHELSIAMSIIDMVEEETGRLGGRKVEAVHLRIGRLSGIVHDALRSSFELATDGTPLAGTRLVIEDVPVLVQCPTCGEPREVRSIQEFRCVVCGTFTGEVVAGRELLVTALEMEA
jgi:hydrogenase nickel incorporation protein HypA/HybF